MGRMRLMSVSILVLTTLIACRSSEDPAPAAQTHAATRESVLRTLYEGHRWFELRDEVMKPDAPLFYKGVVEAAFNQEPAAESDLGSFIASHSDEDLTLRAEYALFHLWRRRGQYSKAAKLALSILKERPGDTEISGRFRDVEFPASVGDQQVVSRKPTPIQAELIGQRLVLPVKVNGMAARFALDNGTLPSIVSKSEANRLGLIISSLPDGPMGSNLLAGYAVARDFEVAGMHLKNVAFRVVPDRSASGHLRTELLGLPVVLALGRFVWNPKSSTFVTLPESGKGLDASSNLAFEGIYTFVQLTSRGEPLRLFLDTGSDASVLYQSFVAAHRAMFLGLPMGNCGGEALGRQEVLRCIVLPSIPLKVDPAEVSFGPVRAMLSNVGPNNDWFDGRIGIDLLLYASAIDFDFGSMKLSLDCGFMGCSKPVASAPNAASMGGIPVA